MLVGVTDGLRGLGRVAGARRWRNGNGTAHSGRSGKEYLCVAGRGDGW